MEKRGKNFIIHKSRPRLKFKGFYPVVKVFSASVLPAAVLLSYNSKRFSQIKNLKGYIPFLCKSCVESKQHFLNYFLLCIWLCGSQGRRRLHGIICMNSWQTLFLPFRENRIGKKFRIGLMHLLHRCKKGQGRWEYWINWILTVSIPILKTPHIVLHR